MSSRIIVVLHKNTPMGIERYILDYDSFSSYIKYNEMIDKLYADGYYYPPERYHSHT